MKKTIKKEKSSGKTFSITNYIKNSNKSQLSNEKLPSKCYKIHEYLKHNAVGYENRKSAKEIMDIFGIDKDDILRMYIRKIRDSETLHKPICSKAGSNGMNGYWIATDVEEIIKSANNLEHRGWDLIKRARRMKRKARLNNQRRLIFGRCEKDMIESVIKDG